MAIRPSRRPSVLTKNRVSELRANATEPEKLLWSQLRGRNIAGLKFRRQHPLEPYIVDFYCAGARLVVEVDGESHDGREEHDRARTDYLSSLGLEIIRVTNDDVLANLEGVIELIARVAGERLESPLP